MNINLFKNGDIITRTCESEDGCNDFQGTKLVFRYVRDGIIHALSPWGLIALPVEDWSEGWRYYIKSYNGEFDSMTSDHMGIIPLPLPAVYDVPQFIVTEQGVNYFREQVNRDIKRRMVECRRISILNSITHYKQQLREAIESENYERAALLKKKIEEKENELKSKQ